MSRCASASGHVDVEVLEALELTSNGGQRASARRDASQVNAKVSHRHRSLQQIGRSWRPREHHESLNEESHDEQQRRGRRSHRDSGPREPGRVVLAPTVGVEVAAGGPAKWTSEPGDGVRGLSSQALARADVVAATTRRASPRASRCVDRVVVDGLATRSVAALGADGRAAHGAPSFIGHMPGHISVRVISPTT